ncbi:MAG: tryptophan 2,3-dioxygenase [Alphaproteobacteria bacterium RIFCSPHIGHO2_12_FULL_63_12]|nr:MAG: tryptophan 2,3-dioxygenase [Alphaproteobacteria bacterium RIFCSPHIGHO2_12_FULL_63_12]
MSRNVEKFDGWIRGRFVEFNTALEELYYAQKDRANVDGVGDDLKKAIFDEGNGFVSALRDEGNTDEGFDSAFDVLGGLGLWLAALRRHELTNPAREEKSPFHDASALGMHIGASIGIVPRFATSHLSTHNAAVNGRPKRFTSLKDERLFLDYNTCGIFAYKRAADALMRIVPLGVSHPVAPTLFDDARAALEDVSKWNEALFAELDTDRFFFSVRPYYKPYRVGRHEYRGANAGDFSGINEIDLLTGLCRANDPYYSQLLVDKMLFMRPEDQASLRDCMRRRNFLDLFLEAAPTAKSEPWFSKNTAAFIRVLDAHGKAAAQHHDMLVSKFIEKPSVALDEVKLSQVTASGPPLPVLLRSLAMLRDLRMAAPRTDIPTRTDDVARLKAMIA